MCLNPEHDFAPIRRGGEFLEPASMLGSRVAMAEAVVLLSVTDKGLKSAARLATLLGPFCCQYHFGNVSQGETRHLEGRNIQRGRNLKRG